MHHMGRFAVLATWVTGFWFIAPYAAYSQAPSTTAKTKPLIESIEGAKTLELEIHDKKRQVGVGGQIEFGERIKTGNEISAVILYPDGSKITVIPNTDFAIEEPTEGTQWNKLHSGSVRGIITKTNIPAATKPKFIIRNKSAVLGVRGTDFVMAINAASSSAQVNTLEGSVEVATNEVSLLSGKGVAVAEGQFVQATPSGVGPTQSFDKGEFLKSFNGGGTPPAPPGAPPPGGPGLSAGALSITPPQSIPTRKNFPAPERSPPPEGAPKEIQKELVFGAPPPEKEENFTFFAFQFGGLYTVLPLNSRAKVAKAVSAFWTPRFIIPVLRFLSVRGHFGASFAPNPELLDNSWAMEYQIYATCSIFNFVYGEVGMGEQIWRGNQNMDGGLATANIGFLFKKSFIDRFYIGYQVMNFLPVFNQYKAGIGIHF